MKDLSIEEKAKRYDEALGKARQLCAYPTSKPFISDLQDLFPELKESEDEKIRKELIRAFKSFNSIKVWNGIERTNILAWLEKQGEHKSIWHNENEEPQKGSLILLIMQNGTPIVAKIIEPNHTFNHGEKWAYIDDLLEKPQGKSALEAIKEEKIDNANGVEPKFHEGDWVVSKLDGKARRISEVYCDEYNKYYIVEENEYNIEEYDRLHRLWTIEDAKDGDVLAFNDNIIVIFKDLYNATTFHSYCHIEDGTFDVSTDKLPDWWEGEGFHPATKEQRNKLEKAMTNAGYKWDEDKKEPIKL